MVCKKKARTSKRHCNKRKKKHSSHHTTHKNSDNNNKLCKKKKSSHGKMKKPENHQNNKTCKKDCPIIVDECTYKPIKDIPDRSYQLAQNVKILSNGLKIMDKIVENISLVISTFCVINDNEILVNRILFHTHKLYCEFLKMINCLTGNLTIYLIKSLEFCSDLLWDIICEVYDKKETHHLLIEINKKNDEIIKVMTFQYEVLNKRLIENAAKKIC